MRLSLRSFPPRVVAFYSYPNPLTNIPMVSQWGNIQTGPVQLSAKREGVRMMDRLSKANPTCNVQQGFRFFFYSLISNKKKWRKKTHTNTAHEDPGDRVKRIIIDPRFPFRRVSTGAKAPAVERFEPIPKRKRQRRAPVPGPCSTDSLLGHLTINTSFVPNVRMMTEEWGGGEIREKDWKHERDMTCGGNEQKQHPSWMIQLCANRSSLRARLKLEAVSSSPGGKWGGETQTSFHS